MLSSSKKYIHNNFTFQYYIDISRIINNVSAALLTLTYSSSMPFVSPQQLGEPGGYA